MVNTNIEKRIGNIFGMTGGNYAGNVYDKNGIAPSILTMQGGYRQPMIVDVICVAERGRNKEGGGGTYAQQLEPNLNGMTNTITGVAKDNMILEKIDCYHCGAFDFDYGSCTIPSYELEYACPLRNLENKKNEENNR